MLNLSSYILPDVANSPQNSAKYPSLHSVIDLKSKINYPEISQLNSNGRAAPKHIESYIINHTSITYVSCIASIQLLWIFPKRRNIKNIFAPFPDQTPQGALLRRVKILSPLRLSQSFKISEANPERLLSMQKPDKERATELMLNCRRVISSSLSAQISKMWNWAGVRKKRHQIKPKPATELVIPVQGCWTKGLHRSKWASKLYQRMCFLQGWLYPHDPEFEVNILIGAVIVSLTVGQE